MRSRNVARFAKDRERLFRQLRRVLYVIRARLMEGGLKRRAVKRTGGPDRFTRATGKLITDEISAVKIHKYLGAVRPR